MQNVPFLVFPLALLSKVRPLEYIKFQTVRNKCLSMMISHLVLPHCYRFSQLANQSLLGGTIFPHMVTTSYPKWLKFIKKGKYQLCEMSPFWYFLELCYPKFVHLSIKSSVPSNDDNSGVSWRFGLKFGVPMHLKTRIMEFKYYLIPSSGSGVILKKRSKWLYFSCIWVRQERPSKS